jgi:hypothetical protein
MRHSHICISKCHGIGEETGRSKISQFHFSILSEEDIFGLDLSVQHMLLVNMVYSKAHLCEPIKYHIFRK